MPKPEAKKQASQPLTEQQEQELSAYIKGELLPFVANVRISDQTRLNIRVGQKSIPTLDLAKYPDKTKLRPLLAKFKAELNRSR
jgi:hypothetical protein